MYGWAQERQRRWHDRSRHAQVEASTRWTLSAMPWLVFLAGGPQILVLADRSPFAASMVWGVLLLGLSQCALATRLTGPALDVYLGAGTLPRTRLVPVLAGLALVTVVATGFVAVAGGRDGVAHGLVLLGTTAPALCILALIVRVRTFFLLHACLIVLALAGLAAAGMASADLARTALPLLVVGPAVLFAQRCSGWYVAVLRELAAAREVQARLAVAEERLRFARDLHDVLGRNLSIIALKSELAAQLSRRGADRAATEEQMEEVQLLARDSQREVREVVRAYRSADFPAELAGAQEVLGAAGVECRVHADSTDAGQALPEAAQSALAWVVREGTTNVLRHARSAAVCTVTLAATGDAATLVMENDGAHEDPAGPGTEGSGLNGLRERLAALGGTLTVQQPNRTTFRVTATVPLTPSSAATVPGRRPAVLAGAAGPGPRGEVR